MQSTTNTLLGHKLTYKITPTGGKILDSDNLATARRVTFTPSVFGQGHKTNGKYLDPNNLIYHKTMEWYPYGTETWYNTFDSPGTSWMNSGVLPSYAINYDDSNMPSNSQVYNDCVKKLYDKIRNADMNLAIDWAERDQTKKMLHNAWKSAEKVIPWAQKARSHAKKGMTVDEAHHAIGNAWLGYTYGWRPLLQTIYGLCTFVRSTKQEITVKQRSQRKGILDKAGGGGVNPPWKFRTICSQRYEIGITYQIAEPNLFDLTRLTTLNPLAIAWEVLPYSFVIDWFLDVGGYLQAWEQSLFRGLTFVRGYKTNTTQSVTVGSYRGFYTPVGFNRGPFWVDAEWTRIQRDLSRSKLLDPPKVNLPSFDVKLGWQRMTSAAALLQQILLPDPKMFRMK